MLPFTELILLRGRNILRVFKPIKYTGIGNKLIILIVIKLKVYTYKKKITCDFYSNIP